jgi:radial spoke head protein 1
MVYPDGTKYCGTNYIISGTFANGKRHGLGVYQYINGDVYQGEWADDFRNGKGTYSYSTGGKVSIYLYRNRERG